MSEAWMPSLRKLNLLLSGTGSTGENNFLSEVACCAIMRNNAHILKPPAPWCHRPALFRTDSKPATLINTTGEQPMKTVKVQTASLAGLAIDWAVAKATGLTPTIMSNCETLEDYIAIRNSGAPWRFSPSRSWSDGGPLIEKYGLGVAKFYEPVDGPVPPGCEWAALWRDDSKRMDGPTALIAACRAIAAFKLGETVEIPASLLNQ